MVKGMSLVLGFALAAGVTLAQETVPGSSSDDETIKLLVDRINVVLEKNSNLERDLADARARVGSLEAMTSGEPWPIVVFKSCPQGRTVLDAFCSGFPVTQRGEEFFCNIAHLHGETPARVLCE